MSCQTNVQKVANKAARASGIPPLASQYAYTIQQFRPAAPPSTPPAKAAVLREANLPELRAVLLQAALPDQQVAERLAGLEDKELLTALGQYEAECRRRNRALRRLELIRSIRLGWSVIHVISHVTTFRELAKLLVFGKVPKPKRAAKVATGVVALVAVFIVFKGVKLGISEVAEMYCYKVRERRRQKLLANLNHNPG